MQSNSSKLLSEKLYNLVQIFETENLRLGIYHDIMSDYIARLENLTDNIEDTRSSKYEQSKICDKHLRNVSFKISCLLDRDEDIIEELHEAIGLLEEL